MKPWISQLGTVWWGARIDSEASRILPTTGDISKRVKKQTCQLRANTCNRVRGIKMRWIKQGDGKTQTRDQWSKPKATKTKWNRKHSKLYLQQGLYKRVLRCTREVGSLTAKFKVMYCIRKKCPNECQCWAQCACVCCVSYHYNWLECRKYQQQS